MYKDQEELQRHKRAVIDRLTHTMLVREEYIRLIKRIKSVLERIGFSEVEVLEKRLHKVDAIMDMLDSFENSTSTHKIAKGLLVDSCSFIIHNCQFAVFRLDSSGKIQECHFVVITSNEFNYIGGYRIWRGRVTPNISPVFHVLKTTWNAQDFMASTVQSDSVIIAASNDIQIWLSHFALDTLPSKQYEGCTQESK